MALLLAAALMVTATAGCSQQPGIPTPVPTSTATASKAEVDAAQRTMDRLVDAVQGRDPDLYDRQLSQQDPGFASSASMIYRNLSGLGLTKFKITLTQQRRDLSAPRRGTLGGRAWVAVALVNWAVAGDRHPSDHTIGLTFLAEDDRQLLAGTSDGDLETGQPLWLAEPVQAEHRDHATVIAGAQVRLEPWLDRANRASRAVARERAGDPVDLVLEVPSNERSLERVLAAKPGAYRPIAAVTWPEGTELAKAPLRVIVNPVPAGALGSTALDILLTHEATHVATSSPASAAPLWVVEGYADYLAYKAFPQARDAASADLLADVKANGVPRRLPANDAFTPAASGLDLSYAEAWFAFRYLAEQYSDKAANEFYAEVDSSGDVDRAIRTTLDGSLVEFTRGWQRYLEDAAGKV